MISRQVQFDRGGEPQMGDSENKLSKQKEAVQTG